MTVSSSKCNPRVAIQNSSNLGRMKISDASGKEGSEFVKMQSYCS